MLILTPLDPSISGGIPLQIRQETIHDFPAVYQVVKSAFQNAPHSDGNEQDLVESLRKSVAFIPQLSLVAVEEDQVVGHILFTRAKVQDVAVLALAPLSVLPAYQNQGIGRALIERGHKLAKEMHYPYAVVLGHPDFYSAAGYKKASQFKIKPPFEVEDAYFMAIPLSDSPVALDGIMQYDPAFGI